MSEQTSGPFGARSEPGKISEPEFKRLCGQVWAESLIGLEGQDELCWGQTDRECELLAAVLVRLRRKLGLDGDWTERELAFAQHDATLYQDEISRLMRQNADAPFDYNRIINRLLREVVREQTV